MKYISANIILKTNVPNFASSSCLIDHHNELQSEFFAIVANVRIGFDNIEIAEIKHRIFSFDT